MNTLLKIEDLTTYFFTMYGVVKAVDGVSFEIKEKETVGLIGESGSGKTVTGLSILRLVPQPGKILKGSIIFRGKNLLEESEKEMQRIRGKKISMIFQNPNTSLNPVFRIGRQLTEVIRVHQNLKKEEASKKAIDLLRIVGIPDAEQRFEWFPHEFSGGMKQRIGIARALLCRPDLVIADEPTSSVDVTIQAQILKLMMNLKKRFGMALLLITHDMGVVAETCDRIIVVYAGRICAIADAQTIFSNAAHPYVQALLRSIPQESKVKKLSVMPGRVPDLADPPEGCRFHPRCAYARARCKEQPPLREIEPGHHVACWQPLG